ncbi:chemotaxis protein CheW [Natronospira bacteriovora]|uniref:Chemotaxis protein CheW n=1 Tax=Natronospira bacteriovora TaxID=3069753 RepID=A0ABU0W360_9GAMM|nr:chemotaxis protein CheW [Natronospira sp. AB-CW4]MDQ2068449.1 chemotaxis protein CheW [Natronospira sp. AB-CW4]
MSEEDRQEHRASEARPAPARKKSARRAERKQEPREQWVSFRLGRERYAIQATHVQEILKAGNITPVPGAEHFVLGVINLRGNIVTVIDTRLRFALDEPDQECIHQVIVLETEDQVLGLMVDDVDEVIDIRPSEIEPAPQFENNQVSRHILGVVRREDGLTVLVDVRRLMPNEEKDRKQAV